MEVKGLQNRRKIDFVRTQESEQKNACENEEKGAQKWSKKESGGDKKAIKKASKKTAVFDGFPGGTQDPSNPDQ